MCEGHFRATPDLTKLPEEVEPYVSVDGFYDKVLLSVSTPRLTIRCMKGCSTMFSSYKAMVEHAIHERHSQNHSIVRTGPYYVGGCPYEFLGFECHLDWAGWSEAYNGENTRAKYRATDRWLHTVMREGIPCRCGVFLSSPLEAAFHIFGTGLQSCSHSNTTGIIPSSQRHIIWKGLQNRNTVAGSLGVLGQLSAAEIVTEQQRLGLSARANTVFNDSQVLFLRRYSSAGPNDARFTPLTLLAQHHEVFSLKAGMKLISKDFCPTAVTPLISFSSAYTAILPPQSKNVVDPAVVGQATKYLHRYMCCAGDFTNDILLALLELPIDRRIMFVSEDNFTCNATLLAWLCWTQEPFKIHWTIEKQKVDDLRGLGARRWKQAMQNGHVDYYGMHFNRHWILLRSKDIADGWIARLREDESYTANAMIEGFLDWCEEWQGHKGTRKHGRNKQVSTTYSTVGSVAAVLMELLDDAMRDEA